MIDKDFISKLKHLGKGRHRITYLLPSGLNVLKVPINEAGRHANLCESTLFHFKRAPYPVARCAMLHGTGFLIMEYVEPVYRSQLTVVPAWADLVDCFQVGFTRKGKLVAYDYTNF